jgi:hypothetical protein
VFDVKLSQRRRLNTDFQKLTDEQISAPESIEKFKNEYSIDVPRLLEEHKYATNRIVKVDVSRDQMRMIFDRSRPFYIDATEITVHIPFEGDGGVFDIRPPSLTIAETKGDVAGGELLLIATITRPELDAGPFLEREIGYVRSNLEQLRTLAATFGDELNQELATCIARHEQKMAIHSKLLGTLGMPVRVPPPPPAITSAAPFIKPRPAVPASWDVFISHASEDKDGIARPLARALEARGKRVWFDEFTLRVGDSLRRSIDTGLARSRFGIVVLSKSFFGRHWPEQELNGLATKEVKGVKVILPVWHGVSHEEVAEYSPTLADRLAASSDRGIEYVIEKLLEAMD